MLNELKTLEGDTWFQLGDKDLATHFIRTSMLNDGKSLTDITATLQVDLVSNQISFLCQITWLVHLSKLIETYFLSRIFRKTSLLACCK